MLPTLGVNFLHNQSKQGCWTHIPSASNRSEPSQRTLIKSPRGVLRRKHLVKESKSPAKTRNPRQAIWIPRRKQATARKLSVHEKHHFINAFSFSKQCCGSFLNPDVDPYKLPVKNFSGLNSFCKICEFSLSLLSLPHFFWGSGHFVLDKNRRKSSVMFKICHPVLETQKQP